MDPADPADQAQTLKARQNRQRQIADRGPWQTRYLVRRKFGRGVEPLRLILTALQQYLRAVMPPQRTAPVHSLRPKLFTYTPCVHASVSTFTPCIPCIPLVYEYIYLGYFFRSGLPPVYNIHGVLSNIQGVSSICTSCIRYVYLYSPCIPCILCIPLVYSGDPMYIGFGCNFLLYFFILYRG